MSTLFKHRPAAKPRVSTLVLALLVLVGLLIDCAKGDLHAAGVGLAALVFATWVDHLERRIQWYEGAR